MATKTIKLIKPWRMHSKGAVFTTDAPVAALLIQSGRAVEEKPAEVKPVEQKAGKKK